MNDLPGRGDVNPYGIPMPNPHEREGPDEDEGSEEQRWRDNYAALAKQYDAAIYDRDQARAGADELVEAIKEARRELTIAHGNQVTDAILRRALARYREARMSERGRIYEFDARVVVPELQEDLAKARAEADQLREALREIANIPTDNATAIRYGPIIARRALGDTEHE